jgi:hypothetical protein
LKVAHSRELKSSLKDKNQELNLRKREGSSRNGSQGSFSLLLSGQQPKGVGGGLFIAPTPKRAVGELFTGLVQWTALEADLNRTSPVKWLETRKKQFWNLVSTPDKSGGAL